MSPSGQEEHNDENHCSPALRFRHSHRRRRRSLESGQKELMQDQMSFLLRQSADGRKPVPVSSWFGWTGERNTLSGDEQIEELHDNDRTHLLGDTKYPSVYPETFDRQKYSPMGEFNYGSESSNNEEKDVEEKREKIESPPMEAETNRQGWQRMHLPKMEMRHRRHRTRRQGDEDGGVASESNETDTELDQEQKLKLAFVFIVLPSLMMIMYGHSKLKGNSSNGNSISGDLSALDHLRALGGMHGGMHGGFGGHHPPHHFGGEEDEDSLLGPPSGDSNDPLNMVRNHLRQQRRRYDGKPQNVRKTKRDYSKSGQASTENSKPSTDSDPNVPKTAQPPSFQPSKQSSSQPSKTNEEKKSDDSMTINLEQDQDKRAIPSDSQDDHYPPDFDSPANFESDLEKLYRSPPGHHDYENVEFDDFVDGNDPLQNWNHPPPLSPFHRRNDETEEEEEDVSLPIETETFPSTKTDRIVLVWSERKLRPLDGASVFEYFNCPERRCIFTRDRRMQKEADALLLDYELLRQSDVQLPSRMAGQRWMLFAEQPPQPLASTAAERLDRMQFEFTWTYRMDADIPLSRPFLTADQGRVPAPDANSESMRNLFDHKRRQLLLIPVDFCLSRPLAKESPNKNDQSDWQENPAIVESVNKFTMNSNIEQFLDPVIKAETEELNSQKRLPKAVLAMLSETTQKLVQTLNEQVDMDLLIRCDLEEQQMRSLLRQYMFVLILEEVMCANYRSPYVYWALEEHTVPILSNTANYQNLLPKGAIVDLKRFQTPSELQQFIRMVSGDVRSYFKFWDWRRHLQISHRRTDLCEMCKRLHAIPSAAETRKKHLAEKNLARKLAELKSKPLGNNENQQQDVHVNEEQPKNQPSIPEGSGSNQRQTNTNPLHVETDPIYNKPKQQQSQQPVQDQFQPTTTKRISLSSWLQKTKCSRIDFSYLLQ